MMSVANRVLTCIRELPDATSNDIVELMSDVPAGSVSSALVNLYAKKKVTRTEARTATNRLTYQYRVADPRTAPEPKLRKYATRKFTKTQDMANRAPFPSNDTTTKTSMSKASLRGRISQLETENAELRRFKAEALERFPDLAVEPNVLKARKIVHDLLASTDKCRANDVMLGRADGTLVMRATVEALNKA